MDCHELEFGIRHINSGINVSLSSIEIFKITVGLTIGLKNKDIYFWGKINGINNDYYICYIIENKTSFPEKKFKWSIDMINYTDLPDSFSSYLLNHVIEHPVYIFTGNPKKLLNELSDTPEEGEEETETVDASETATELDRLALTVSEIDKNTSVVPRGAYEITGNNQVKKNRSFNGLTNENALELSSWCHFCPAKNVAQLRALCRDDNQFSSDFLDPLDTDIPTGAWMIRDNIDSVILRSLVWPGYCCYHLPKTRFWGGLYIGDGDKCREVPFLM
eukprot:GHVL01025572.1.p2 GENE.GHVL01025572.1~~GHVL01025572.1.p2  ORF type:complete len:285 (-),score=72.74 GHVL01025572.1:1241-2068(-)